MTRRAHVGLWRLAIGASTAAVTVAASVTAAGAAPTPEPSTVTATATGAAESVTTQLSGSSLQLDWSKREGATHYLLIDDRTQTVLWRGESTSAQLPLAAPNSSDVLLVAATPRGANPVAEILATHPPAESGLTPLVTVTTEATANAAWGPIAQVPAYDVGEGKPGQVQTLSRSTKAATQLPARLGQTGRFTITGDPVEPASAKPEDDVTKRYGVEITPPSTGTDTIPPDAQVGQTVPQSQPAQSTARTSTDYQTYIPRKYVDAPENFTQVPCEGSLGGPDWWYSGDTRRGPEYDSDQYRTRGNYQVDWSGRQTAPSKSVHASSRYERTEDGRYIYDSTRRADDSGFHPRVISNDGNYARNVIEHDVALPYCTPPGPIPDPAITYANQQDLYRGGGHWIYGSHDKMPNHQMYRTDYNPDGSRRVDLIFNHEFQDPTCLYNLICGSQQYQYVR